MPMHPQQQGMLPPPPPPPADAANERDMGTDEAVFALRQQLAIACEQTPNAAMQNKMGIEVSVHKKSDASDVRNK